MRREEQFNRAWIAALLSLKQPHQFRHAPRIEPGAAQVEHPFLVRLALVVAAELRHRRVGRNGGTYLGDLRAAAVAQQRIEEAQANARREPLAESIGGVPIRDVGDLVRHDGRQLGFVLRRQNRAAVNPDRSARQRESVDLARIRHRKTVWIARPVGIGRNRPTEALDISRHPSIPDFRDLLTDLSLGLASDLNFLFDRDQTECANACHAARAKRKRQNGRRQPSKNARAMSVSHATAFGKGRATRDGLNWTGFRGSEPLR